MSQARGTRRGASRSISSTCWGSEARSETPIMASSWLARSTRSARSSRVRFEMPEIADPYAAAAVLVLVGRADPPAGGPDVLALLAGLVEQLVIGHHQVGAIGDEEAARRRDPACHRAVELGEERLGVEDHAVAHQAGAPAGAGCPRGSGGGRTARPRSPRCGPRWRRPGSEPPGRPARPAHRRACPCLRRPTGRRRPPRNGSWDRTWWLQASRTDNKKAPLGAGASSGQF